VLQAWKDLLQNTVEDSMPAALSLEQESPVLHVSTCSFHCRSLHCFSATICWSFLCHSNVFSQSTASLPTSAGHVFATQTFSVRALLLCQHLHVSSCSFHCRALVCFSASNLCWSFHSQSTHCQSDQCFTANICQLLRCFSADM